MQALKSGPDALDHPRSLLPVDLTLDTIRVAWTEGDLGQLLLNSIFVSVVVTIGVMLTSLLAADVQARAFAHHGGAPAARRPTLATAAAGAALGGYLLHFLPGPPGDPLAPAIAVLGLLLLADGAQRFRAARAGRYAPSLLRFLLPSNVLRPERLAFQAHRDAEQDALGVLRQG
jgi:hypothetical protein